MHDFIEKSYFKEIERKTKLQTAFAFPTSMMVVGTALIGNAFDKWQHINPGFNWLGAMLFGVSVIALLAFLYNAAIFLVARTYRYMWTPRQARDHYLKLTEFAKEFPDTPPADETFREQLTTDLANCAEMNTRLNDARSSNLYWANLAAFIYILAGLTGSAISTLTPFFEETRMSENKAPPPPPPPPPPVRDVKDGANSPRPNTK